MRVALLFACLASITSITNGCKNLDPGGYYAEEERDGRVYVLGTEDGHARFAASGEIPYAHTRIGSGPNGETLVFEVDKEGDELRDRLVRHYGAKHGLELAEN